ncbi:MAG: lipid-A-disaccharide synthase, partial [Candidatus Zixiibacteriota bacterium]
MLVILPFEKEFYRQHGIEAKFVGHYLLEDIPADYVDSPIPRTSPPTLCLMPGSRPQEIQRMLPPMLQAAAVLQQRHGAAVVIAGVKDTFDYEGMIHRYGSRGHISLVLGESRKSIFESRPVLTASGTATLETGIIGRPMVVAYKTGFITYQIARHLVRLDSVALVNLVLGERVAPELIQSRVSPECLLPELEKHILDPSYTDAVKSKLATLTEKLGGPGASERAARLIADRL